MQANNKNRLVERLAYLYAHACTHTRIRIRTYIHAYTRLEKRPMLTES